MFVFKNVGKIKNNKNVKKTWQEEKKRKTYHIYALGRKMAKYWDTCAFMHLLDIMAYAPSYTLSSVVFAWTLRGVIVVVVVVVVVIA